MLMNLAENISSADMKTIAIGSFEIKKGKVDNLYRERRSEDFNCEVMAIWRNKSAENTKEVIHLQSFKKSRTVYISVI